MSLFFELVEVELHPLDLLDSHLQDVENNLKHPKPSMMQAFATNQSSLTETELIRIREHIEVENCERCAEDIKMLRNIMSL